MEELNLTGIPVRDLQQMLNLISLDSPSLPRLAVDGIFGELTLEAVMIFQRDHQIPVTGVVDLFTWQAIYQAAQSYLRRLGPPPLLSVLDSGSFQGLPGSDSPQIQMAQMIFCALSSHVGNFTPCSQDQGNQGNTQKNLRTLQKLAGLEETGILDRETWSFLVRLYRTLVVRRQTNSLY